MALEPDGVAMMEIGACRLGSASRTQRPGATGGGIGTRRLRRAAPGRAGSAACAKSRRDVKSPARRRMRGPGPRHGGRSLPRRPAPHSSTLRSAGSSWSRCAARSACRVAGTTTSPSLSAAIASISAIKRGFPPAACATFARRAPAIRSPISSSTSSSARGWRLSVTDQVGWALTELGRAMQSTRMGTSRKQGEVLDQVVERLLAPLDVVEHDHERLLLSARPLRASCERPTRSPQRRW